MLPGVESTASKDKRRSSRIVRTVLIIGFLTMIVGYSALTKGFPKASEIKLSPGLAKAVELSNMIAVTASSAMASASLSTVHNSTLLAMARSASLNSSLLSPMLGASRRTLRKSEDGGGEGEGDDPVEEDNCEHVADQEDPCAYVLDKCGEAAGVINYLKLRYCQMNANGGTVFVVIFFTLIWLFILISMLGSTADNFFVPALTLISKELNLSPTVAGMTFLAIGNGAPDIFTALAGAAANDFPLVLAALNGAGVCISCFVMGNVILVGNIEVPALGFWRDIGAYAAGMAIIIGICTDGVIKLWEAIMFLALYILYVTVVVIWLQCRRCRDAERKKRNKLASVTPHLHPEAITDSMQNDVPMQVSPSIRPQPAATAAASSTSASGGPAAIVGTPALDMSLVVDAVNVDTGASSSAAAAETATSPLSPSADADSELELEMVGAGPANLDADEDELVDQAVWLDGLSYPHPEWEKKPQWLRVLLKIQYFAELPFSFLRWLTVPSPHVRPDHWGVAKRRFALCTPIFLTFLLLINARGTDGFSMDVGSLPAPVLCLIVGLGTSALFTAWYYLCVKNAAISNSAARRHAAYRDAGIEAMGAAGGDDDVFAQHVNAKADRGLASPFLADEAVQGVQVQSANGALSGTVLASPTDAFASASAPAAGAGAGAGATPGSAASSGQSQRVLKRKRRSSRAGEGENDDDDDDEEPVPVAVKVFQIVVALIAFIAAVNWLNIIAGEVVAVLQSLGIMFNVSSAILGLTVLAMGNSIPDWISNTAMARAGHPQTAIASIFGSPLLTTFVGLGASLTITCLRDYPTPFVFEVKTQVIITWVAVGLSTVMHMVLFPVFKYRPPKQYGVVLILAYVAFIVTTVVYELNK